MKRLLPVLLILAMVLSTAVAATGCGTTDSEEADNGYTVVEQEEEALQEEEEATLEEEEEVADTEETTASSSKLTAQKSATGSTAKSIASAASKSSSAKSSSTSSKSSSSKSSSSSSSSKKADSTASTGTSTSTVEDTDSTTDTGSATVDTGSTTTDTGSTTVDTGSTTTDTGSTTVDTGSITTDPETTTEDPEETVVGYTITVQENPGGSVTVVGDLTQAQEGDTVSFTVEADDNYTINSVGYWTIKDNGTKGSLVSLTETDGVYSFTMPAGNVGVGASFTDASDYPTKSDTQQTSDKWTVYVALQDAWLHPSDTSIDARIILDQRFLTECQDTELVLELRQYGTGGYVLVGKKTITYSELVEMCSEENENVTIADGCITIDHVTFELAEGYSFEEDKYVYCYINVGRPSWIDARGEILYRTAYSDDATVLAEDATEPAPIVWLYNLDANTYRGALIRSILDELGIPYGTVDSSNLGQSIGYLVNWEGYEAVEDPYVDESYDLEYMLMGNLVETDLDDLLESMSEHNIKISLKSVPTAWTASKTFVELFSIMADEDAAFNAYINLNNMTYTAESIVDNEAYVGSDAYEAFLVAYNAAVDALMGGEELEAEEYEALLANLQTAYLLVTNRTLITQDLELILTDNGDGTYTVSAQLVDGTEDITYTYLWQDKSTDDTITVTAENLYKVKLTISGSGSYYGDVVAKLAVPSDVETTIVTTASSIDVTFAEATSLLNQPAVTQYLAVLYDAEGNEVATQTISQAGTITFSDLAADTTYTLKTYALNVVGRSNITEQTITTDSLTD